LADVRRFAVARAVLDTALDGSAGVRGAVVRGRIRGGRRLEPPVRVVWRSIMHRAHFAQLVPVVFLVATGCAAKTVPPPASAFGQQPDTSAAALAAPAAAPADAPSSTNSSVRIEDRILRACGDIPSARFAFDSAGIKPDAAAALDAVARCFAQGPLAGRSMRLVGHADPRGETDYNLGLGQRRAGAVAAYIGQHGVAPSHLATTSRGAFDATGTDDEGWSRDRRVDVLLAE
jgi:peptidoglycan-associated lipoprotein